MSEEKNVVALKMHESDRFALEIAKLNRKVANAEAQAALSKNETAELQYRHVVLQVYLKYGLNENDTINSETGEIIKNGNLADGEKVA